MFWRILLPPSSGLRVRIALLIRQKFVCLPHLFSRGQNTRSSLKYCLIFGVFKHQDNGKHSKNYMVLYKTYSFASFPIWKMPHIFKILLSLTFIRDNGDSGLLVCNTVFMDEGFPTSWNKPYVPSKHHEPPVQWQSVASHKIWISAIPLQEPPNLSSTLFVSSEYKPGLYQV